MISDCQDRLLPRQSALFTLPSIVSASRVLIAGLLVYEMGRTPQRILLAALIGVPLVFLLDAVDGIVARRLKCQSLLGSFIDILADRAVEFIFLWYFVRAGLVPLWFILIFYSRILLTDACRVRAFGMEQVSVTGILLPLPWRSIVLSKLSRSAYAGVKGLLFSVLLLGLYSGSPRVSPLGTVVMIVVLAFSLLRAAPILITYLPSNRLVVTARIGANNSGGKNMATLTTKVTSWMQIVADVLLTLTLVITYAR